MFKRKKKSNNIGQVILPIGHPNPPEQHEIEAAHTLARYFQCNTVIFELKNRPSVKRVIIINKSGECIAFNK